MSSSAQSMLDYMSHRLQRLGHLTKVAALQSCEERWEVTLRDVRLMRLVAIEPGLIFGRLVALAMLEKSMVSKLVNALVRQGLLRREMDTTDARQIHLFLSATGDSLVAQSMELDAQLEAWLVESPTDEERDTFMRCIDKLTAKLPELLVMIPRTSRSGMQGRRLQR